MGKALAVQPEFNPKNPQKARCSHTSVILEGLQEIGSREILLQLKSQLAGISSDRETLSQDRSKDEDQILKASC